MAATQDGTLQSSGNFYKALNKALDVMFDDVESSNKLKTQSVSTSFGSLLDSAFTPKTFDNNYDYQYYNYDFSKANEVLENDIYQCYLKDQITNYACPTFYDLSAKWVYFDDDFSGGSQGINIF